MIRRLLTGLATALGVVALVTASAGGPAPAVVAAGSGPGCMMCPDPGFNPS